MFRDPALVEVSAESVSTSSGINWGEGVTTVGGPSVRGFVACPSGMAGESEGDSRHCSDSFVGGMSPYNSSAALTISG